MLFFLTNSGERIREHCSPLLYQKLKNIYICILCAYVCVCTYTLAGTVVKNLLANAEGIGNSGLIPGFGRSPGGGHGNPLQHSCLENFMDRGAWQATVHEVAKSWTEWLNFHFYRQLRQLQVYKYLKGRLCLLQAWCWEHIKLYSL